MIFKTKSEGHRRPSTNHVLLIMKLIVVLILLNITAVWADGYAQNITLKVNGISLVQVMKSIQQQTGYGFFIKSKDLAQTRVNANIQGMEIEVAMEKLLQGKSAAWELENNTIIIKPQTSNVPPIRNTKIIPI